MSNDSYYHLYRLNDVNYDYAQTTTAISCDICYIIEDGKVKQVSAKELAIEEIKAQPFY